MQDPVLPTPGTLGAAPWTGPILPPWPDVAPASGPVLLRAFGPADLPLALELSTDPYVPTIGTLPAAATEAQAGPTGSSASATAGRRAPASRSR
jgi:hypothetical protein